MRPRITDSASCRESRKWRVVRRPREPERVTGHGSLLEYTSRTRLFPMNQTPSSCDVLVIGGGIAGLVAANRAAELGQRTIVLEKGTADRYLCSSRYTGGTFHI